MKRKILSFVLVLSIVVSCAVMLSACGIKNKDGGFSRGECGRDIFPISTVLND